ncbi:MAG TPA: three-Cys-motif partner protein TcmP [Ignavibacteria bacterium]|nr:three-Cys-motif partner protein TcmP [Ignavibacteria bacterium]
MTRESFYERQTALTAAKIEIYRKYLEGYLPKLLMQFGTCLIADLFCGAGKNGDKNGSPLVLIDRAKYILSSSHLKEKQIQILFNDQDSSNIQNLEEELKKNEFGNNIQIIKILNDKFEVLLPQIIKKYKNDNIPKFFFLDPFTYANVTIEHLKQLLSLPHTEVLLFLPIFHSYRFSSDQKMSGKNKTRIFVEQFTTRGITDYKDIDDFMDSVKEKLLSELSLDYVRHVLLDGGVSKNSLFLLTKHQAGMLLMNKIAIKMSEDGSRINVETQDQSSIFGIEVTTKFEDFKQSLTIKLKSKKEMTNYEIVDFTIKNEFLPKHGKKVIEELFGQKMIKIYDVDKNEIRNRSRWNIAEKMTKKRIFIWEA